MDIFGLAREFAFPSNTYRFAPFWFLNHELEDEELIWQINEMHNNGVGGFILHARHGRITPYLSDEWMDRMETCIKEADRLGMKVILYDEDNWPSGAVGGELIEQYPEYRMSGCRISQEWVVSGGKKLEERLEILDELIAVAAVPVGRSGMLEGLPGSAISLMKFVEDGMLRWKAPAGRWCVMVFARKWLAPAHFFNGYLDTMSKPAVAKFIEMTHEKYAQRFEKYFGGTIDGIFTDEPSMNYNDSGSIPWTPTLPSEFRWRKGYDLLGALPALFKDAGEITPQLRCDFYDVATALYEEAYFKQIYEWCDERRLNSIGHVMCEGELLPSTRHQGDFFRGARWMHYGGCDYLCEMTWPEINETGSPLNNLVGPKLASSAAHLNRLPRVMSEAFGIASGWKIDLRTLKWMTDWQVMLGVNYFQPHAFYYSIQGFRKWECPPGEFYQSAFWPFYKHFADYTARLSAALAHSDHFADVAVVFPARAMWAAVAPECTPEAVRIVKSFERVTAGLLRAGFDFDLIPEEVLNREFDPTLMQHVVSLENYKAVVVPCSGALHRETVMTLIECMESMNPVIACDGVSSVFVADSADDWAESYPDAAEFADSFRLEYSWKKKSLDKRPGLDDAADIPAVIIPDVADRELDDVAHALSVSIGEFVDPFIIVKEKGSHLPYVPDIVHCLYRRGGVDFAFLVNTSRTNSYSTVVRIDSIGAPAIWDAMTGRLQEISVLGFGEDGLSLEFELEFKPTQAYLIGIDTEDVTPPIGSAKPVVSQEKSFKLADEWQFSTEKPNALPLTEWKVKMGAERDEWPYGALCYTAEFECGVVPKSAALLVDGLLTEKLWRRSVPIDVEIDINGVQVKEFKKGSYLDHLIKEADVTGLIKKGTNSVSIRTRTHLAPAGTITDPAFLIGDFALERGGSGFRIVEPKSTLRTGSWAEQGYPFYSGIGVYKQKVDLPAPDGRVILRTSKPGDAAEVIINGKSAGVMLWEPWEIDITSFVKAGENDVEIRVANSMSNLIDLRPRPSGILECVEIVFCS